MAGSEDYVTMSEHDADAVVADIAEATGWPEADVRTVLACLLPGNRTPGGLVCVPGKTVPPPEIRDCEVCGTPMSIGKFAKKRTALTCSGKCRLQKWLKKTAQ